MPSTGLPTAFVGVLPGKAQSRSELVRPEIRLAIESRGQAFEELAQDNAAVSPGAHKGSARHGGGHLAGARRADAFGFRHHLSQREKHISARVAVGDREHVEGVQRVHVGFEQPKRRREHTAGSATKLDKIKNLHVLSVGVHLERLGEEPSTIQPSSIAWSTCIDTSRPTATTSIIKWLGSAAAR